MTKAKTKTKSRLSNDAAVLLQRLTRLAAADDHGMVKCFTCSAVKHLTLCDGGHWISRTYLAHKLDPDNVHPQCKGCNGFKGSNPIVYTLRMIDTYGDEWVRDMEARKRDRPKWTRASLLELIAELKAEIAIEEDRLGPHAHRPEAGG